MFPPEVRALGVGLSYAVGNAIFGGSAEFVALSLKSAGVESAFYWYVSALCLVALIISLRMPDPQRDGHLKGDVAMNPDDEHGEADAASGKLHKPA